MQKAFLGLLVKLEELLDDHDLPGHLVRHLSKVTTLHYQTSPHRQRRDWCCFGFVNVTDVDSNGTYDIRNFGTANNFIFYCICPQKKTDSSA